jgi:hypothetical protein
MNPKIKDIALQTGGSHYPEVNSTLLEKFATNIINECIDAVRTGNLGIAYTTFDQGVVDASIERSIASINHRFNL